MLQVSHSASGVAAGRKAELADGFTTAAICEPLFNPLNVAVVRGVVEFAAKHVMPLGGLKGLNARHSPGAIGAVPRAILQ